MKNWKKYTLAVAIITVAGFAYVKNSQRNIPSDLRDAVADATESKDFDTAIPALEKVKVDVSAPKANVVNTVPFKMYCHLKYNFNEPGGMGKDCVHHDIIVTEENTEYRKYGALYGEMLEHIAYFYYKIVPSDSGYYTINVIFDKKGKIPDTFVNKYEHYYPLLRATFNVNHLPFESG